MIPRPLFDLAVGAFLATAFTACGGESDTSGEARQNAVTIPSAATLEAEAAEAIDAGNADDEFDRLKSEIEGGS